MGLNDFFIFGHGLKHTEAVDPARHPDGQTFPSKLINQRHEPELAAIVGLGRAKQETG